MIKFILHTIFSVTFIFLSYHGLGQNADSTFSQLSILSSEHPSRNTQTPGKEDILDFRSVNQKLSPFLNYQAGNDGNRILPANITSRALFSPNPFFYLNYPFLSNPDGYKFISSIKPFTFLSYYQAGKEDEAFQQMKIIHTQKLSQKFTFGISAVNQIANGSFQNEQNKNYQVNIWTTVQLNKFKSFILAEITSIKSQESGGLVNDSTFLNGQFDNPRFNLPVNLTQAKSEQNIRSLNIRNDWLLIDDSLSASLSLQLNSVFSLKNRLYQDQGNNLQFYQSLGLDSIYSFDSLSMLVVENQPAIVIVNAQNQINPYLFLGITHRLTQSYYQTKIIDHNLQLNAVADLSLFPTYETRTKLDYHFSGYSSGNFQWELRMNQFKDTLKSTFLNFYGIISQKKAPLATHFITEQLVNQKILPQTNFHLNSSIENRKETFRLYANAGLVKNYIYFNDSAWIVNHLNTEIFLETGIHSSISSDHTKWTNDFTVQWISGGSWMAYPRWIYKTSIEYSNHLFSDKLDFSIGSSLWLNENAWYPAYHPVLGAFYEQKAKKGELIPLIDVYFKFRIKNAGFYVRYENLLSVRGYKYQMAIAGFPAQMPRLGIGINWYMFD